MIYENKYGVTFDVVSPTYGRYHSYRTWNLYPTQKPTIEPPAPKILTIDIPGADGVIDYTEALTGNVNYKTRKAEMKYKFIGERSRWDTIYHHMLKVLHGKRMKIRLDEDGSGYYEGRLTVGAPEYESKENTMRITVTGDMDPYKYEPYSSTEPWIWDTFCFATDTIRYYKDIAVNSNSFYDFTLVGSDMPVIPDFKLKSGSVDLKYTAEGGAVKTVSLASGSNIDKTPDLILRSGTRTVQLKGNGVIDIEYRGGCL